MRRSVMIVVAACALTACNRPSHVGDRSSIPFAVFQTNQMVVTDLEKPLTIPVAAGSVASPQTVYSDQPSIVSVEGASLVAHAPGRADLHSTTGSKLTVLVISSGTLELRPGRVHLVPLERRSVSVLADGEAIPPGEVRWECPQPEIACGNAGTISAGVVGGATQLLARVGAMSGTLSVDAEAPRKGALTLSPDHARLTVGETLRLSPRLYGSSVPAAWSGAGVAVEHLGNGLMVAKKPGFASVCATVGAQSVCSKIEVSR